MTEMQELNQAIDLSLGKISNQLAKESHHPQDLLSSPAQRAKQIEGALREEIKEFRQKCVAGMNALTNVDPQIKEQLEVAFKRITNLRQIGKQIAQGKRCIEILGLEESSMHSLYEAAKWLLEQNRFEEAESAFTFLVLLDHAQYSYWLGLGHARSYLLRHDQAIEAYKRAQELQPTLFWPHIFIANCLIDKNDFSGAVIELEVAQKLYLEEKKRDHEMERALFERITFVKNRGKA